MDRSGQGLQAASPHETDGSDSAGPPAKTGARLGVFIAVGLGIAFLGVLGVRVKQSVAKRENVAKERVATEARGVTKEAIVTARAVSTKWVPRVDVTGTLKPWRDADVGFETPGRLVRVSAAIGDRVAAAQVLAVLDASRAAAQVGQAESQVAAAEANLALAQDGLTRTESLAATHSIPDAQVEQARQQVALAKAQLAGAAASTRLAKSGAGLHSISAPFAGIVTRAPTGIGSVVNAGVPLVHIEDTSRFRLSASVGEDEVPMISVGAKVRVLYRARAVDGVVVAVVKSLDQATRRAPVEIEVPNPNNDLLAWGFVRARISGRGDIDAVRVPALARRPGSQDEIVKVENGIAKITRAVFAVDEDGSLIVQRGLSANEEVVLSPSADLKDGDPIAQAAIGNTHPGPAGRAR
jgi:RND family efflux transporter MFP subunit